jgi:hypothetical protein
MSMENIRRTWEFCKERGILVMLDATRALENAWFIKQREPGYQEKSVREILKEICSYSDGATVSSKKDNLVNIGGFLALRDPELARRARALLVAFEGLQTYGGMSGRDMEALARGIREMVDGDDHVPDRPGGAPGGCSAAGVPSCPSRARGVPRRPHHPVHLPQDHLPPRLQAPFTPIPGAGHGAGHRSAGRNMRSATTTGPGWSWSAHHPGGCTPSPHGRDGRVGGAVYEREEVRAALHLRAAGPALLRSRRPDRGPRRPGPAPLPAAAGAGTP